MQLLKHLLMDLEYYGALNSVDEYLAETDTDGGMVVQTLVFDTTTFPDKDAVRDWVESHYFEVYKEIEDLGDSFKVQQLDESEFVDNTFKTIEIRSGVEAIVGVLKQATVGGLFAFSLRNEKSIKLNSDLPHVIEIAKVVKGYHPSYGIVEITTDMLKSFVKNFDAGAYGVDLSIDYDHETREAAGWVRGLFLDYDEQVLLAEVKWTPKGVLSLSDREFRYFSPEFTENYVHPHTGVEHGPTLLGGALVNRPFLKMDAIIGLKDKNIKQENNVDTIKMSEHTSIVEKKDAELIKLQLTAEKSKNVISGMKDENKKLSDELETFKSEKQEAERVAKLDKLFSENKVNKAQYAALKEDADKDIFDVLALSEKMNTTPDGGSKGNPNDTISLSDDEREMCIKMDLTPEEFVKFNK